MQLGFNWLKELVDFEWDAAELCERLTMAGVACESTRPVFEEFSGVVAGKIKKVERHPESENLSICTVDIGLKTVTTVCGAPNAAVGLKSSFATVGAELPDGTRIEPVEKQGIKSEGMLCSEKELGLSDESSIIMELEAGIKTGSDLWEKLDLDEPLIEFELTPNRPDCMSAIGIAREIAALAGTVVKRPEFELDEIEKQAAEEVRIEIADPQACPRYAARIIEHIKVARSPFWLKRKLFAAGIRPINNVVDITNLVLMEYGQPLHAFDYELFSMPQVLVRTALENEKFTTLDEKEHTLKEDDILITDATKAVALGGIMGGLNSEVNENTNKVLLESAYFNPTNICRTRKRLAIQSESAVRFEKGADPNIVDTACNYAAYLLSKLAGGRVLNGIVDAYPRVIEPLSIELRPSRVNQLLATDITAPQMIDILHSLEFGIKSGKTIMVDVPTFRPDCTREVDLVEEIARIYGYDKIGTSLRASGDLLAERSTEELFIERIRENLGRQGLYEIMTINLIDPDKGRKLGMEDKFIGLLNPLSADLAAYRTNLFMNMLQVVARNLNRRQNDLKLFEIGNIAYRADASHIEETHLAIGICGRPDVRNWAVSEQEYDFFDLKGVAEEFCKGLRLGNLTLKEQNHPFLERGVSFDLYFGDTHVGLGGRASNNSLNLYDIETPVYYIELNIGKLIPLYTKDLVYRKLPKFPSVWRDIAVIVDEGIFADRLLQTIYGSGNNILVNAELFDVYTGRQIEEGKKSLAFNLEFRSEEKTLTDEEVEPVFNHIISQLQNQFDAKLRT
ncbi:MAG TPA: phenylalanine--tRNA ligase subunit beta [candidate division Zixibacteria bacterium]|nr:phenylalanine--tRNA ligase subunit beta [candidate division Zixibacteria bacterium]